MIKVLPFIAITTLGFSAENCSPSQPKCYTNTVCESCYCLGPEQVVANAPIRPLICNGDFSIKVAGLCWKANQDGLEYALDTSVPFDPFVSIFREPNNLVDAKYLNPNFKWSFGYKIGVSYSSFCDGWDIGIFWTHFKGAASSHIETERTDNHILLALWSAFQTGKTGATGPFPGPQVLDIKTNWKLNLNLVDLSLGREFWVSKYLTVRPSIALRYASIDQKYCLEHKGGDLEGFAALQPDLNDWVELENDFYGIGILGGFDTNWHLGCGWAIHGTLATSIIYGRFDLDQDEYTREAESPFLKTRILETEDHFRASRAILDLVLGVEYSTLVCDCKYGFTIQFGWDQHLFFHQNQLWRVTREDANRFQFPNLSGENNHEQRRGTLETHGFTLSLRLDF